MAKFDSDKWLAISAMVVSIGTLAALSYQALLMRDAERASKLPYLYISLRSNPQQGVALLLSNSGIGPAIVDDVTVHYQGRDIPGDPFDFFISLDENKKVELGSDKVQRGRLIPAGVTIVMLEFVPAPSAPPEAMLPELLKLFDIAEVPAAWYTRWGGKAQHGVIEIKYSSVYGERWRVRSDRIVPDRL